MFTEFKQVKKLSSHFADSEPDEKLSSYFAVNSWPWLLIRYLIDPFLFMLVCHNLFLFMPIFLGWQIRNAFFEGAVVPMFWIVFWVFIHTLWLLLKCLFLITDQFSIRLQFWLNLVSDILCVKTKKTKLHKTHTILYFSKFIFSVLNKTASN